MADLMTDPDTTTVQNPHVVFWRGVADLQTPVGVLLKLAGNEPNSFLLESIEGGSARGRFSVIGMAPDLIWRSRDGIADISHGGGDFTAITEKPLDSLRALIAASRFPLPALLPPMIGGLFGYLGYDMARQMERLPVSGIDDLAVPDAIMLRPTLFAVFDNVRDELIIASPVRPRPNEPIAAARARAEDCVAAARTRLNQALPPAPEPVFLPAPAAPISNMSHAAFIDIVLRMKEYITAGDVFQVVPSQRFTTDFTLPPLALYRALRRINPAPFLFFLNFGAFSIVGSSPEVLVRLRDGTITIRPLAGTRPRGTSAADDQRLEDELLADPKERAEHLMLVDLGRNDVGRVATTGSVRVTESFVVEKFSHVMHISSNVEGQVRDGVDALAALIAGFPAGTLTGAPKIRAMEIINEMEPTRRGIYAGCVGYFGPDGNMDTCIGLRMALVKDGKMHVQAGCGIVADSVPEAEYQETRAKARALFRAAEEAVRFAAGES